MTMRTLSAILLLATGAAAAQDAAPAHPQCAGAITTPEFNACSADELAQARAALDVTFRAALAKWHASPETVMALQRSQDAWGATFEADVAARFAATDAARTRGEWVGTAYPSAHNWYEARLVKERVDYLCEFLRGAAYGERSSDSCDHLVHAALGDTAN